jgi:hypothetical protein
MYRLFPNVIVLIVCVFVYVNIKKYVDVKCYLSNDYSDSFILEEVNAI